MIEEQKYKYIETIVIVIFIILSIFNIFLGEYTYKDLKLYLSSLSNDIINVIVGGISIFLLFIKNKKLELIRNGFYLVFIYSLIALIFLSERMLILIISMVLILFFLTILILKLKNIFTSNLSVKLEHNLIYALPTLILGGIFIARAFGIINNYFKGSATVIEYATSVADIPICLIWIGISVLCLLKKKIGLITIPAILFQTCILFLSLIVYLIINPIISETELKITDLIVISSMAIIFIIPFILLLREKSI